MSEFNQVQYAHNLVTSLSATSSKKDKLAMLATAWGAPEAGVFRSVALASLDPFLNYGCGAKSLPKDYLVGDQDFDSATWQLLSDLETRKVVANSIEGKLAIKSELERLNHYSGELLKGILVKRFATGVSADTINAVSPGAIYLFKVHLAEKFADHVSNITEDEWKAGVYGEVKEDGWRGVSLPNKQYHFVSRNGIPINSDRDLREQVSDFLNLWAEAFPEYESEQLCVDCELVEASDVFNETAGNAGSKDESRAGTLQVKVIDVLTLSELSQGSATPYLERRSRLDTFFNEYGQNRLNEIGNRIKLIDRFKFHSEEEVHAKFEDLNNPKSGAKKKEGLMIKISSAGWYPKRTTGWLKVKGRITKDLVVKYLSPGDELGKYAGMMGAAVCDYVNSKGETVEVSIGGGWSLKQRAEYWASFTGEPVTYFTTDKGVVTEHTAVPCDCDDIVGQMIEVKAHEETKDGSLRHPNFSRIRTDKPLDEGQGN